MPVDMRIQMKQKDLARTFMMISNLKNNTNIFRRCKGY